MPDPILVGRNEDKLSALCEALRRREVHHRSGRRPGRRRLQHLLRRHPDRSAADRCAQGDRRRQSTSTARSRPPPPRRRRWPCYHEATAAGVKNGVVQDKLWLPGLLKLKLLIDTGFFGEILSVRGEFGYWVFDGDLPALPAPVLELPQGGRRRHHHRHALPLALRDRQPLRRGRRRCPAWAPPTSRSAGTNRASPTPAPPTTRPTPPSSSRTA